MLRENLFLGFSTRSDTNQAVQPQAIARDLKLRIKKVEGWYKYYLCRKNKGTDQLCGYHAADLRLSFQISKKQVYSRRGSYLDNITLWHCKRHKQMRIYCVGRNQGKERVVAENIKNDLNSIGSALRFILRVFALD